MRICNHAAHPSISRQLVIRVTTPQIVMLVRFDPSVFWRLENGGGSSILVGKELGHISPPHHPFSSSLPPLALCSTSPFEGV